MRLEVANLETQDLRELVTAQSDGVMLDLVVLDVRSGPEIAMTGHLFDGARHLVLDEVLGGALDLSEDDFEDKYGYAKPAKTDMLVMSCAAGVRSAAAAKVADGAGYERVYNYLGGANEWFSS